MNISLPKCWPKLNPTYSQCHLIKTTMDKLTKANPTVNDMTSH